MNPRELVDVGRIVGVYGYQGTLKVKPLSDFPERFLGLSKIQLRKGETRSEVLVESCHQHRGLILMKLKGLESREEARKYLNAYLSVYEDEVFPLPEGYYYHFQLIGLQVFDQEKGYLGTVKEILETGANDVYVIDFGDFGEILLPAIKEVIIAVNLVDKRMEIKLPQGLLEKP